MKGLKYNMGYGILTLEKQLELLKMKDEGQDIDVFNWEPQITNYIYNKEMALKSLKEKLDTCKSELKQSKNILKELKK